MLGFQSSTKHEAKCNVTHGAMGHLDPKQPPIKRKPFGNILNSSFIQKVELILPDEVYQIIKKTVLAEWTKPVYSRVIMPLAALLEGEFFNEYIKKGNILMLSEGKPGVDRVFSLREGVLTLYLDKESYERAGIVGKPDGVKGKRGTKPRWVVEINLRLPSMLHGKKGFDRIVYAFKNVLDTPVTWLFCDLGTTTLTPEPIDVHFPTMVTIDAEIVTDIKASLPPLNPPTDIDLQYGGDFEEFATETHEWLSLISLGSPRIDPDDKIDPYLSRYAPLGDKITRAKLVKITWRGFLTSTWTHRTFVEALVVAPRNAWFAYSVMGFGVGWSGVTKDCTILKPPNAPDEYVLWEVSL